MKLRILNIITCLFITACIATSCLEDDTFEFELSADASITAFSINNIETEYQDTIDGKDTTLVATVIGSNYPFVIDQNLGLIYNLDSLPVGTDVSKVVPEITADGYIYIAAETDSIWEEEDSLDFSKPISFKVMSLKGTYGRTYVTKINVHKQDPNLMSWNKVTNSFQTSIQKQKAVYFNQQIMVFAEGEEQVSVTSTHQDNGAEWTSLQTIDIPVRADYSSVIVWGEALYILADNDLYQSSNGLNWSKVQTGQKLKSLTACVNNDKEKRIIGTTLDNFYAESSDIHTWSVYSSMPTGFPEGIYHYAAYPLNTNKEFNRLVVMGQNELDGDTTNVVWTQQTNEHEWISLHMENNLKNCPNLENSSMIYYNNQLYVFGGPGKNNSTAKAFDYFYTSNDHGIGWEKITEDVLFPECFNKLYASANGNYSYVVDDNHFLWIMWSGTGEVWKGRINKLGFTEQ